MLSLPRIAYRTPPTTATGGAPQKTRRLPTVHGQGVTVFAVRVKLACVTAETGDFEAVVVVNGSIWENVEPPEVDNPPGAPAGKAQALLFPDFASALAQDTVRLLGERSDHHESKTRIGCHPLPSYVDRG